jgi:hypothetical protein
MMGGTDHLLQLKIRWISLFFGVGVVGRGGRDEEQKKKKRKRRRDQEWANVRDGVGYGGLSG